MLAACALFRYTLHKQPTQKPAADTSTRISEEGITNPTCNTQQAAETPSKLLLILQACSNITRDIYGEADIIQDNKNEKEKDIY